LTWNVFELELGTIKVLLQLVPNAVILCLLLNVDLFIELFDKLLSV